MQFDSFFDTVKHFTDSEKSIDYDRGKLILQVRDELIEVEIKIKNNDVFVIENELSLPAFTWIKNRLGKLDVLANRIMEFLPFESHYIPVSGSFVDIIERDPEERIVEITNVDKFLLKQLGDQLPGETSVTYLISDAGEGKTTIINHVAIEQAKIFKSGNSPWLLLPIPLGGRPFIRLDDLIVGTLSNQLRFPFLYFDAVIELVKLGAIVLVLDGFEEMFVENATGDGISALGSLVGRLESKGNLLLAARKAYFEFKNFATQGKLFDSFSDEDVNFSKINIHRWGKSQFIQYGNKRNEPNADRIYNAISERMEFDHPLLSRAVLVKRVFDIFSEHGFEESLDRLTKGGDSYFKGFIDVILEREAQEKWINKSGEELSQPLLKKFQHYSLLSDIAEEMWGSRTDSLPSDVIDTISDLFCDNYNIDPGSSRQIKERLKQHALIVPSPQQKGSFKFDHDEFLNYFLGEKLTNLILNGRDVELRRLLREGALPSFTVDIVATSLKNKEHSISKSLDFILEMVSSEGPSSFTRENSGLLLINLLDKYETSSFTVKELIFPSGSLAHKTLKNIMFDKCSFQATDTGGSEFSNVNFRYCDFERIDIDDDAKFKDVEMFSCNISSLYLKGSDSHIYEPDLILKYLKNYNIRISYEEGVQIELEPIVEEDDLILTKKAFRTFARATYVNEDIFKVRLGNEGAYFTSNVLPVLIKAGILEVITYKGGGRQRRFKMKIKMGAFENAYSKAKGSFTSFINQFTNE